MYAGGASVFSGNRDLNSGAGLFLLLLALLAANLPFASQRNLLLPWRVAKPDKSFGWRVLEWLVLYGLMAVVARLLEARGGQVYPQSWEFHAITVCLFLVLAYPGFVWRYLWQHRRATR